MLCSCVYDQLRHILMAHVNIFEWIIKCSSVAMSVEWYKSTILYVVLQNKTSYPYVKMMETFDMAEV